MKKTLFIALLTSFITNAQVREKGSVEIQPYAGFSTSKLYSDGGATYKSIVSPSFGVDFEFYFSSKWSLRSGIEFLEIGLKNPTFFDPYSVRNEPKYEERLSNIAVPIHAAVHFGKKRNLYLNFGPTLIYGISYKTTDGLGTDINDIEDRFYGGLGIGVGYKLPINETFSLALDYQSFTRIPEFITYGSETHFYFYGSSALNVKAIINLSSNKESK